MASRRKKPSTLSGTEQEDFLAAATRLHEACCRPLLRTDSDHYRALRDLNQSICHSIRVITGHDPEWMRLPPPEARARFGAKE